MALLKAIVASIQAIVEGKIGPAANWIEGVLAKGVPIVISLLANLLGLGGIGKKVKEIIGKFQAKIDKALDKLIDTLWEKGKGDAIREKAEEVGNKAMEPARAAGRKVKSGAKKAASAVAEKAKPAVDKVKEAAQPLADAHAKLDAKMAPLNAKAAKLDADMKKAHTDLKELEKKPKKIREKAIADLEAKAASVGLGAKDLEEKSKKVGDKNAATVTNKAKDLGKKAGVLDKKLDDKAEATAADGDPKNLATAMMASKAGGLELYWDAKAGDNHAKLMFKGPHKGRLTTKTLPAMKKDAAKLSGEAKKNAQMAIESAQLQAMGTESRGGDYIRGETKDVAAIKKSVDLLAKLMLGAVNSMASVNSDASAAGDKEADLPPPVPFTTADGEKHKIFYKGEGADARLMVASRESELRTKVEAEWAPLLKNKGPNDKKAAGKHIGKVMRAAKKADAIVSSGGDSAAAAAPMKEAALPLAELFVIMEPPPNRWDSGVHDPFQHPSWEVLKLRAGALDPPMAEAQARTLWKAVMDAVGVSCSATAKEKAGGAANQALSETLRGQAQTQFKNIAQALLAGRFDMLDGKEYCLWSGGSITEQFARGQGFTTLESTNAGELFNNLHILGESRDLWANLAPLWQELSRAFAGMPAIGKIHAFQRWQGDTFKNVEKKELERRARSADALDKLEFGYHAVVAKDKLANDRDNEGLGLNKVAYEDLTDLGEFGSEAGWKSAIDQHEAAVKTRHAAAATGTPP